MKKLTIEKKIIETEIVFGVEEINALKKMLLYVNHRIHKHPESGINKVICESEKYLLGKWLNEI